MWDLWVRDHLGRRTSQKFEIIAVLGVGFMLTSYILWMISTFYVVAPVRTPPPTLSSLSGWISPLSSGTQQAPSPSLPVASSYLQHGADVKLHRELGQDVCSGQGLVCVHPQVLGLARAQQALRD